MYYPNMKLHKKFQEQFEKIMGTILSGETIEGTKNVLNKNNTHIIKLILFYEHRENMFFKVLGFVIYGIMGKYVCLKYLFIQHDKLSSNDRSFHDSTFEYLSGIGIPEVLMNIISCHCFS